MNLDSDTAIREPIDVRMLRDVARWADERAALEATCRNEIEGLDEELPPMPAEQQSLLVEELLRLRQGRSTASTLRPYVVPGDDQEEREDGDDHDLLETIEQPVTPLVAANDGIAWRRVASHVGVAAVAAAFTLWMVPAAEPTVTAEDPTEIYQGVELIAGSAADEGLCPGQETRVRISGAIPSPETLEVVFAATDESAATHWALHHPVTDDWSFDGEGLHFQGPLRDLARLDPGAWSLTVQVGPRGSCGPDAGPACARLDAGTLRVAKPERC